MFFNCSTSSYLLSAQKHKDCVLIVLAGKNVSSRTKKNTCENRGKHLNGIENAFHRICSLSFQLDKKYTPSVQIFLFDKNRSRYQEKTTPVIGADSSTDGHRDAVLNRSISITCNRGRGMESSNFHKVLFHESNVSLQPSDANIIRKSQIEQGIGSRSERLQWL